MDISRKLALSIVAMFASVAPSFAAESMCSSSASTDFGGMAEGAHDTLSETQNGGQAGGYIHNANDNLGDSEAARGSNMPLPVVIPASTANNGSSVPQSNDSRHDLQQIPRWGNPLRGKDSYPLSARSQGHNYYAPGSAGASSAGSKSNVKYYGYGYPTTQSAIHTNQQF